MAREYASVRATLALIRMLDQAAAAEHRDIAIATIEIQSETMMGNPPPATVSLLEPAQTYQSRFGKLQSPV